MKKRLRLTAAAMAAIMLFGTAGCGKDGDSKEGGTTAAPNTNTTQESAGTTASESEATSAANSTEAEKLQAEEPLSLSIMLPYGSNEYDNDEFVKKFRSDIETYTNTKTEWIFYDNDMYGEKVTLLYASGDLPSILVTGKDPQFINACNNDMFWEVGDYIYEPEYPNLNTISETVFLNASINGRLYGVPRSRTLARNGAGYRLDWLNNLGLKEPETLDEFYDMLVAFTNGDPDGNGKNDTYGIGMCTWTGPLDIMQLWFGVPNGWGIDANGDLVPAHMTEEYNTALKWFRKIYSEGLINPDFQDIPTENWDELLRGGVAGASADVIDRFRRNQDYFNKESIPAETMLIGAVDAGYGLRCLPTAGYANMLSISKVKIKTEDEMKRALKFLDMVNDAYIQTLITWGYEGETFQYDEDGYPVLLGDDEKTVSFSWNAGYNQLLPYFQCAEELAKMPATAPITDPTKLLQEQLYKENEQYCIPNYGAPYTSDTYVAVGKELDEIISKARTDYMTGVIDDVGLQEAKDQWLRSGGEDVIKEMNELYHANK